MLNTGIASAISLRSRGSLSFTTTDYSHCSNGRSPFDYSSLTPCCSCCCTSSYAVPICPNYGYNLYGLKQSSLIQWSCYRRPISNGFDYYARLPACDIDRTCYCDKVSNFRETSVGRKRGELRKCFVYEERSEIYNLGGVDEAEAILSLLAEDIGEECFLETKETRRLVRKPVVEKRKNGSVCQECGSKKDIVEQGVSESGRGPMVSSRKDDSRRRKEMIQSEENKQAILREEHECSSLKNRREEREKEEREALLRKASQKSVDKQDRELMRRKNLKLRSRTEDKEELLRREHRQVVREDSSRRDEKEELLRREEHMQKVRKDGSSCSSYYSLSSNGDYDTADEVELISSTGQKSYSRNNELVYQDTGEEGHEGYREDHGSSLANRSSSKEFNTGLGVVECDFRKKSEKRLADISVEEIESRTETSLKESKSTISHERTHEKSSNYVGCDDRKEKSTESTKFEEERTQQQRGGEVLRQSETMLKYKQFVGSQDIRSGNVVDSTGSQKVYTGKGEISAKVAALIQGRSSREDEYRRNSSKSSEVSDIQEIDIRKTSISQQSFETNVKRDDYSTTIHGSVDNAVHQQQNDRVSGQVEFRGKSHQLIKNDGESISRRQTNEFAKLEENVGSSRNEFDELNKVIVANSGNTGATLVEHRNKNKSETPVRPPQDLSEIGTLSLGSTAGIATDDTNGGSLQLESTILPGINVQGSLVVHPEAYGGDKTNSSHGQSSRFISDEDAIGSAARLEKSSTRYVGEFVERVRSEILSSDIQREKETYTTKILHGESSGDPHSIDHNLVSDNQPSGTKGPSDEMWNVDEKSTQEPSKAEVQDNASKDSDVIVKRTGRSLWNTIGDIVRFRWLAHSDSHDSGRKTGGRSSPNQSTSSERWFSGHEAEENEEVVEDKVGGSSTLGLSGRHQQGKTGSQVDKSFSSSTLEGHLGQAGMNAPSSSVTQERSSLQASISLPTGGEISGDTSSAVIIDSSIPLPALRLQRSPAVRGVPEAGEARASSGRSEQIDTGLVEQKESVVDEREVKRKKLQRKDQVVRDRFDEWEEAYRLEAEQRKIDEVFMREALLEAQKAADNWEVPVGAVLVHSGKIIARGCNLVEQLRDSTAHAEIICIREASNMLRTWRLSETTLYVTLEPCPMCAGAILQARIDTLVWGAPNKLLGADGSWIRLFPGDGGNSAEPTDKPPAPVHPFHPKMSIRRGVLASECSDAMQQFFKRRRKQEKKADAPKPPSCLPISSRPSNFMAKMHDTFSIMFCL
ncbi:LOW QUALITY PROTEIN: tRNA(adenine(34)) deaminase, chloroplastic [Salvia miltiorrhiza]|uniref:LOW QUALITY PROTEIN: tRNA(adenine(34)) deaminase, chloroplastic n=1 Tax=Salvia miltiorrhiza TaxID=226208 RepID=UPI0025AB90DC|nr:LOW QUALITY PROTEIN: tRNA(adenine(34)) deaminase, chloroplastic [Salvia miltiorrhiza]